MNPMPEIAPISDMRVRQMEIVQKEIAALTLKLGNSGRLVVRPSGTEPVIRVMAEGDNPDLVSDVVNSLCATIEKAA